MNEVESYGEKNVSLMLLGNKSDLDERLIPGDEASVHTFIKNNLILEICQ